MTTPDAARGIEETLVLAVAFEPAEAVAEQVFGLDDTALRRIVALTLARVGIMEPVEVSLLVTDDTGLRALNRDYRGRDEATDVLSFPLLDAPLVTAPTNELWQPSDGDQTVFESLDPPVASAATAAAGDVLDTEDDEGDEGDESDEGDELDEGDDFAFLTPGDGGLHLGDIAISRDAVVRQAEKAGHSATWELAYLLAHGVLHLVGYDDHTEAGYAAMVAHQEAILTSAGISR